METARLISRPLGIGDVGDVQANFPPWEIVGHMAGYVPWPDPADGAEPGHRRLCAFGDDGGGTVALGAGAAVDAVIGVIDGDEDGDNRDFWLDTVRQGQGLMREACEEVTDVWLEGLGRLVLRTAKAAANTRSRGFSERSRMRRVTREECDRGCGREVSEIWETTRAEWAARAR